jgi:hypothetical protein
MNDTPKSKNWIDKIDLMVCHPRPNAPKPKDWIDKIDLLVHGTCWPKPDKSCSPTGDKSGQ